MSAWKQYRRTNVAEMCAYDPSMDLSQVSVSAPDKNLPVEEFMQGFVARNPQNHEDQWYVARAYFDANFAPIED